MSLGLRESKTRPSEVVESRARPEGLWLVEHPTSDESGDSVKVATWLAGQGLCVRLAGPRPLTAAERRRLGRVELADQLVGPADIALLDVWTAETDSRVLELRRQGVVTSCLGDLLLQQRREHIIGVTGTAGKTTTCWLLRQILAKLVRVRWSTARADNLWPTSRLLRSHRGAHLVVELTSSHLAFCAHSPRVAAITNFWPDHLELHGSEEAYRQAKARLFQWQQPGDWAVLPADDPLATEVARASPARRATFAEGARPTEGVIRVWNEADRLFVETLTERRWRLLPPLFRLGHRRRSLLCALATALAAAGPGDFGPALEHLDRLALPSHRGHFLSPSDFPLQLVDDTLAATPSKARTALRPGCRLVAGGLRQSEGREVHASPQERLKLSEWVEAIERECAGVEAFGPAGEWLAQQLKLKVVHADVLTALRAAMENAGEGQRIVVSPGFPMDQKDRLAVSDYMRWTTAFSTWSKKP